MTKVERFVWSRLRDRQLAGYKFRRQVPIGEYFADFACLTARLVVELDGDGHEDEQYEDRRTAWLEAKGYTVARFGVQQVDESIDEVIEAIYNRLTTEPNEDVGDSQTPTLPSPQGGEVKISETPS
jgi:very-short-patch-repair endonuclease